MKQPITNNLQLITNIPITNTAGVTYYRNHHPHLCEIKLATRVVDTEDKLHRTLVHEMCHVAVWLLDRQGQEVHGPFWQQWAQKAMERCPGLQIEAKHNYGINYKHRFRCTNIQCQALYGSHSPMRRKAIVPYRCRACGHALHPTDHLVVSPTQKIKYIRQAARVCTSMVV